MKRVKPFRANTKLPLWKQVKRYLKKYHPKTPIWHDCDQALFGVARICRDGEWVSVAIYDYDALIDVFYHDFKQSPNEGDTDDDIRTSAIEWVDYNIIGAYIGKRTPIYNCDNSVFGINCELPVVEPKTEEES